MVASLKYRTKKFIENAINKHGDKYSYDRVVYVNAHVLILIFCKKCNDYFEQRPTYHLQGAGCQKCARDLCNKSRTKTTQNFVTRCIKKHGNKYDYSKSVYTGSIDIIEIYCKKCNDYFEQIAGYHLQGNGCQKCNGGHRLTTDEFINKAIKKHGNMYSYDRSVYMGSQQNIIITCSEHGDFSQRPNDHLNGAGCPVCKKKALSEFRMKDIETFLTQVEEKFPGTYDTSLVEYKGADKKIKIKCNRCDFWYVSTPGKILAGYRGCKCSMSKGEQIIFDYFKSSEIKFKSEKPFNHHFYGNRLRFDFYLPEYNICIEYDGIQHYVPQNFSGRDENIEESLVAVKVRDNIKNLICIEKGIKLYRIGYTEFDMITNILDYIFTHNNKS